MILKSCITAKSADLNSFSPAIRDYALLKVNLSARNELARRLLDYIVFKSNQPVKITIQSREIPQSNGNIVVVYTADVVEV